LQLLKDQIPYFKDITDIYNEKNNYENDYFSFDFNEIFDFLSVYIDETLFLINLGWKEWLIIPQNQNASAVDSKLFPSKNSIKNLQTIIHNLKE
jgi:hypothetical protein